jgi:acetoin utilization deacetylase AcuC-like enzyme
MSTALGFDPRCLAHENGSMLTDQRAASWLDVPHVERPERLGRTWAVFEQAGLVEALTLLEPRPATREELELVHTPRLIEAIEAQSATSGPPRSVGLGAAAGPGSWEAALYAAGIVLAATEAVADGTATNAFALVRPPGHHASADQAMGFCLFNNVAIAARLAQTQLDLPRIAIVDWDVHHGNGTEDVFASDPSVLFISLHQDGLYPADRGKLEHRGTGEGEGATINVPLPAGSGDAAYLRAWDDVVAPALDGFNPDLLFVSAGQDPAAADPLGRMRVTTEGFRALTARAKAAAARLCDDRLVVALEGGYSLDHLPFCNLAIVDELAFREPTLPREPLDLDVVDELSEAELAAIERAAAR